MKIERLLPLIFLCFIACIASKCKKEKGDPTSQLPPATQTGANTFGCLVNGQVFVPKRKFGSESPIYQCYYEFLYPGSSDGYVFQVSANRKGSNCELTAISINSDSIVIQEGETFFLGKISKGKAGARYSYYPDCYTSEDTYQTNDIVGGELSITKFDEVNDIVSGTFWFTAVNASGDTVKVTNGRFDMKFTR